MVLIDAGPLAAFFIRRDIHHAWTVSQFKSHPAPFFTCEAVLAEAEHLIERTTADGVSNFRALLERGVIRINFRLSDELESVLRLQRRYSDIPMSMADACLVRMSELFPMAQVFTIDGDFRIYRKSNRQAVSLIFPHT